MQAEPKRIPASEGVGRRTESGAARRLLALIELASHYTREVILTAELRHELRNVAQFHSDYRFLKDNRLHSVTELDRDVEQTEKRIATLTNQRSKLRNRIRHETDPQILSDNKAQRAAITTEITELRKRVKRVQCIRKDTPHLLGLLRTELRVEYELKHPVKERDQAKRRSHEQER